jgi:rfaE bifunctional protein nucleotidyltransferase chain/domain
MFKLTSAAQEFLRKNRHKKIVFTNGCFDIIHSGHTSYLQEAKEQGDVLFLGLNSDASIQRLKGALRPIVNESNRKLVLESLRSVDFVEVFDQDTPLELIKAITPNVLVKGGDWAVEQIVGHEFVLQKGGEVKSLSFKVGLSTTEIVNKIISLHLKD